jgi:NADH dehydrogenase FAD-containing subunit
MATITSEGIANANTLRQQFEGLGLDPSSIPAHPANGKSIIIVGAGAFGSSLALELVTHYSDM